MKLNKLTRREMVENCIVRGFLVAGVPMSASSLFAFWQDGHKQAEKPTPTEVLGPFYKKGAPNSSNLQRILSFLHRRLVSADTDHGPVHRGLGTRKSGLLAEAGHEKNGRGSRRTRFNI
jgi:hypothetical protein